METPNIESNKSDIQNMFNELLDVPKNVMNRNFTAYQKGNPNNVAFLSEIYNGQKLVWSGNLDLTISEETVKVISEKMDCLLNIVHVEDKKIFISFNKGKTILSMDYKNHIKRDVKTKKLVNI